GSPADPARLHLDHRFDVVEGGLEDLQRVVARLLLNQVEGAIAHPLSRALLAARHQDVDELPDGLVPVPGVGDSLAKSDDVSSWHGAPVRLTGRRTLLRTLGAVLGPALFPVG